MRDLRHICAFLGGAIIIAMAMGFFRGAAAEPLLAGYQVAMVRPFAVPLNVAAPESEGRYVAEETVYQIQRYNAKFNLFEKVFLEGTEKIPPGKKVLLVRGEVKAYSRRGSCAVHCQFVDMAKGEVLHELDAHGLRFRVANYIARVIYQKKVEN